MSDLLHPDVRQLLIEARSWLQSLNRADLYDKVNDWTDRATRVLALPPGCEDLQTEARRLRWMVGALVLQLNQLGAVAFLDELDPDAPTSFYEARDLVGRVRLYHSIAPASLKSKRPHR